MARRQFARRSGPTLAQSLVIWISRHRSSGSDSLRRLLRTPLPTAMTVAVIGISLALPAALYVMTENLRTMAGQWEQSAAVSLFLHQDVDTGQAQKLVGQIEQKPEIDHVTLITSDQALAEFKQLGGFEGALDELENNPLPAVLSIYPKKFYSTPERLEQLEHDLSEIPAVDFARMDTRWVERLRAILDLAQYAVLLLSVLLGLGVLLIVGNTIRLEILNRRIEIEIMELVGATAAFVRRPFLYAGAWYGLLGGTTACLLIALMVQQLQKPASNLALLYGGDFPLSGLGLLGVAVVLAGSILLGLIGSWIAVDQHLRGARLGAK